MVKLVFNYLASLFIVFNAVVSGVQTHNIIDSLKIKLKTVTGSVKASTLVDLSYAYWGKSPKESMRFAKEALNYARQINDRKTEGSALNAIGNVFWAQSEYDSALAYYRKSLGIRKKMGDTLGVAGALHNIGMVYSSRGKFYEALQNFHESLNKYTAIKDTFGIAKADNSIGTVLWNLREYKNSLKYFNNSLKLKEAVNDSNGMAVAMNNIGLLYKKLNDLDHAYKYIKQSLDIKEKFGNPISIETAQLNLGSVLMEQGKLEQSLNYLNKALKIAKNITDNETFIRANCMIARIDLKKNNPGEAKQRISKSLVLAKKVNSLPLYITCFSAAREYYSFVKDYKTAFEYSTKLLDYKDSLFSEKLNKRIAELEVKVKAKQKDAEINLLKNEKKIQNLTIEKEKNFRDFLLIASALFILLSVSLLYAYKTKEKVNKELHNLNVTKDKFFSIISHDLKNPFNSIMSFSKMLMDDFENLTDEERKTALSEINKAAINSSNLLDNLLSWSLSQRGLIPIMPEKINMKELVNKTIELLNVSAKNKNIEIISLIKSDFYAYADENTVSTVLRNLISNAVKFTGKGGRVTIDVKTDGNYLQIEVSDSGVGIPAEKLKHLFDLNAPNSIDGTSGEKGTGVGLILCKEFVRKNGGKIWAESKVDIGSTFKFTLPMSK